MFPPEPTFEPEEVGEPAFLTPLLQSGRIDAAKEAAVVGPGLGFGSDFVSYAGFITVNPKFNSNIYFWFFPSQSDPANDPVILWLQVPPKSCVPFRSERKISHDRKHPQCSIQFFSACFQVFNVFKRNIKAKKI